MIRSPAFNLSYDNANDLTGLSRYSNLAGTQLVATTSYSYDTASRLTSIANLNSSLATISYYNYQYNNANWMTSESGTGATGTYTYDADGEVLSDGYTTYSYLCTGQPQTIQKGGKFFQGLLLSVNWADQVFLTLAA